MQRRYGCLDTRVARNPPRVQILTNGSIGQDIMQTALNHCLMQVMSAIHDSLCEVVPLHVMPLASQDLLDCQHQLSCRTVYGRTVAGHRYGCLASNAEVEGLAGAALEHQCI